VNYKVDFSEIAWEKPIKGVRCKTKKQGAKQLRLVEYTKEMDPHWCEKGHFGYILEGKFEIRFESGPLIYAAGDGVFIPPGPKHRHMAKVLSSLVRALFVEQS